MKYFVRLLALFVVLTSFPIITNAATAAELAAQAEALLLQVAALQAQLSAQTGGTVSVPSTVVSSASCPLIGRVLKRGSTGDDVTRLQRFLAVDASIYPEALITGYYGTLTEAAVKRWQTRYNIVSSGDAESTGFGVAGPRTAAAISLQCSTTGSTGGGVGGGMNVSTPTVGGFIQVTPVVGNAPLTVRVTATVNTVNSCQAVNYALEWGDGTIPQSIPVPAGACNQVQQSYTHVFLYGGTYILRLSAGQHSTTATVQVSGIGAPVPINTIVTGATTPVSLSISSPTGGQDFKRGDAVTIAWNAGGSIPSNSQVTLDLYTSNGQKVASNDVIAVTSNAVGSLQWTVPLSSSASCPSTSPKGLCGVNIANGSYKIRATLSSGGQVHVTTESGIFTISGSSDFLYGPLAITPGVQGNALAVGASFDIPSSCTGYTLSWGDGSTSAVQAHSTSCTQSPVSRFFTHEYATSGLYTISLKRGENLAQQDSASLVISN